ncbi:Aste57867_18731 [Aphanomyces stellatus]|uniref:Aste57867_18731 protein n=1 Tax=Aphanomyces stellatus TaxID=120398 RepID=A0A485LBQ5_9STRA|nr:hypothetical protein As57867_018667 [Aphanomyces stellatus]VFT95465.1 Aste57867_18731 [Aphanomyces stellatus]
MPPLLPPPMDGAPPHDGGGSSYGAALRYENSNQIPAMLVLYTVTLCLSASMTLTACATVFKWRVVRASPNHATIFMLFVTLGLWSLSALVNVLLVFAGNGVPPGGRPGSFRGPPRGSPPKGIGYVLYSSAVTDMFFNATSLWWILATYEFQRFVWRPRRLAPRASRNVMLWYNIVVQTISLGYIVSIVVYELLHPPPPPNSSMRLPPPGGVDGANNSSLPRPNGAPSGGQGPLFPRANSTGSAQGPQPQGPPPMQYMMGNLFYAAYGIRWLAVLYPLCVGLWFARDRRQHTSALARSVKSVALFVSLLILVNVPALVLVGLFDFGLMDKEDLFFTYSLSKAGSYAIGAGLAIVLGLYLKDFDALYMPDQTKKSHPRPTTVVGSAFVVLDWDTC